MAVHESSPSPDRPQTLLEAAKALVGTLAWSTHWAKANLIDAIAREEAKATAVQSSIDAAKALRQRAEKAEAELAQARQSLSDVRLVLGAADGELTWMAAEKRVNMHQAAAQGCETLLAAVKAECDTHRKNAYEAAAAADCAPHDVAASIQRWRERTAKVEAEAARLLQDNAELTKRAEVARKVACDLHRILEDAGVPGVNLNMTQMSLVERIGWLISEWKIAQSNAHLLAVARDEQRELLESAQKQCGLERTEAERLRADLDTARDHLQAVVGAAKVACTAMSRAWGLVGTSEQPALDAAQTTLSAAAANARHMVLDRVEPKAPAAAEAPVAPLLDVEWLQSEVERLRKANRDLQEQNWDLQVPDFPPLSLDHLHYAYMPGDWSSQADEWFAYDRLMRNGHPTRLVRVRWRHGPGIPNSDPAQTAMRDQITSLRQELADVHGALSACLRPEVRTGSARGDANRIAKALQVACAQFRVLPGVNVVERDLPLVVDELLRLRGELAKEKAQFADFAAKVWAGDVEAAMGVTRMKSEPDPSDPVNLCGPEVAHSRGIVEKAIDEVMAKKLATEPKVGIVRDPVTGWTFDKFREQHDLNRAAVRVLVSELNMARQQIAGTKGAAQ